MSAATASPHPRAAPHDLVITGGVVVDGTGVAPMRADIGIVGAAVAAVAEPGRLAARQVLDATGHLVTPGFVDIHSHADLTLALDPRAHSALLQGVTSVVTGNCGYGVAPVGRVPLDVVVANAPAGRCADCVARPWDSFHAYLDVLRSGPCGVNVFPLVAHGALRLAAAGPDARATSAAETADMAAMLSEAMQAGALGFSTGLEYAPGSHAEHSELVALSVAAGRHDGLYATHCRNRTVRVVEAAQEAVTVAAAGGCRLQLSHFLPRPAWPDNEGHRRALDRCRAAPVPVAFDVFPFALGPTPLVGMLPDWVRAGGRDDITRRLRDRRLRPRIVAGLDDRLVALARGPAAAEVYVVSDGADGAEVGRTVTELGRGDPLDAVLDLLAAAGPDHADVVVLEPWATACELEHALAAADFFVMGDGVTTSLDGPTAGRSFSLSDWGWVPAMLGTVVRDRGLVSLESAVHRMTLAPATQAGLPDRGSLTVGARADLVVLDLDGLDANRDPARPRQASSGIRDVLVNGRLAVLDGRPTGVLAGDVGLRR
jgi:N-acyl-D-amino-acid deacylase